MKPMIRRRPTMIALRARRQALRIASEIAHPRVDEPARVLVVDAPSEERTPRFDPDAADAIKTLVRACVIIAL